jgi:hypothetical protein
VAWLHDYLPAAGCEIICNPRLPTQLPALVVVRNPRRSATRTQSRQSPAKRVGGSQFAALRSQFERLADQVAQGRPLRNQVTSPVVTPAEAAELLGLDESSIRRGMENGRFCQTTVVDSDGTPPRVGVRISELVGHGAVWSR